MDRLLPQHLARECARLTLPARILVAVSGGADSMALLRGLLEMPVHARHALHVAHLDHQLRGQAARDDANWVAQVCRQLDVPCEIGHVDVAAIAAADGCGIEETARNERYRFLEATALALDCQAIALAHTADDQAETILHHILRGTGLSGLRGIPRERSLPSQVRLVRPLLDLDRRAVLDYLNQIGQEYRHDESNDDHAFTRNRIRRTLLPLLAREYNPHVAQALRRLGQQAAETQAALESTAAALLDRVLESSSAYECRLKWQPFATVPRQLVREALSLLWRRQDWPRQNLGFDQLDELADIAMTGGAATFPGSIDARREARWLVLRRRTGAPDG